ncbi:MAG: CDP-alcohol phosphatidyltransferase family protein [Gemmatimonadales bacterium]
MRTVNAKRQTIDTAPIEAVVTVNLDRRSPKSNKPAAFEPILGRAPVQRHLVQLARAGVEHCAVVVSGAEDAAAMSELRRLIAEPVRLGMEVSLFRAANLEGSDHTSDWAPHVVTVEGEAVYDPRLYSYALESGGPVMLVDGGTSIGIERERRKGKGEKGKGKAEEGRGKREKDTSTIESCAVPVDSLPSYLPNMRRHLRPYWRRLATADDYRLAERMIIDSAQKGVLDFPARYLHPIPENLLASLLARTAITPNHVTVLTGLLAFVATYLFAVQSYGWGLVVALVVNVLDGVDGKLARVKLLSSEFGDRLDHILDVTFEFSWYLGLGWGLSRETGHMLPLYLGAGLIAVMLGTRAVSGAYKSLAGHQIHDHTAFDRAFRLVGGRRNVYIVMLLIGLLLGNVETAFYAAVGWGGVTLVVFKVRAAMAFVGRRKM